MQSEDLDQKITRIMAKLSFVKAILLAEIEDGVEVYEKVKIKEIEFSEEHGGKISGLRHAMSDMFKTILEQVEKLGKGKNKSVSVMYDRYFVQQKQVGDNLLLIIICETESLDMGMLRELTSEFEENFKQVNAIVAEFNSQ